MENSQERVARQVVSVDEAKAAYQKLGDVRRGLDRLGQSVIGPALGVLLPVFALLLSQLLTYAVAPRDWSMDIIALIKKSGASRVDVDNYRAAHLLCFFSTSGTLLFYWRVFYRMFATIYRILIEASFRKEPVRRQCWHC